MNMDYYYFEAEELAADDYFKEWVCSPTEASDQFWNGFLKEYPERYYQVEEGRLLVQALYKLGAEGGSHEQVSRIWNRIELSLSGVRRRTFRPGYWIGAASMILLLALVWYARVGQYDDVMAAAGDPDPAKWQTVANVTRTPAPVSLPDGSTVSLSADSKIQYPRQFGKNQRVVYLSGEAFFEVKRDTGRPFMVYANGLITRVLGTSFTVKALEDAPDVVVAVKSGRVSVYSAHAKSSDNKDPETKGLVLTANQKAVFERSSATLNKTLVDDPVIQATEGVRERFTYEDARAETVFGALARQYGIEVIYDEQIFKNCSLTVQLDDEDLFQKLEVICRVLDAKYKLIDARVVITGSGCY